MATTASDLIIRITGDAKSFKGSLEEASASTEDFNTSLATIAGVAAAAFAIVALGLEKTLEAYKMSEEASNRLTLSLQNQGLFSTTLAEAYKQQAAELQHLTGVDDDAIIKGQAQLQSMIGRTEITKEMTAAAVDLGAAMGGSVDGGFEVLGRAIDGQTRGLKALGIEIDENLTKEERTKQILEKVTVAYGGLAESQNQGLGSSKAFKSALSDIMEDIGSNFAPAVGGATKMLTEFFERLHQSNVQSKSPFYQLDQEIEAVHQGLLNISKGGTYINLNTGKVISDAKELNAELDILMAKRDDLQRSGRGAGMQQDPEKEAEAKKQEALRLDREQRERNALLAHNEQIREATENHTKDVQDLYKQEAEVTAAIADDKNKRIRDQLEAHLENIKVLREEAVQQEIDQDKEFEKEKLDNKDLYNSMSEAQQLDFNERQKASIESQILTEDTAKKQLLINQMNFQVKNHNTQLIEEAKYGKAYALIHATMNSEIYQGTKSAFSNLADLQNSSNSTLKGIGKAAAVANIVIKTAESAMAIYAGFSTIPIIGPALGIAGAAAAVAFGAEQVGRVNAAAKGGLVTGGIPGVDSVPFMLQQQELVSPAKNFEEVVGSVAAKRMAEEQGGSAFGQQTILISMDGREAERVLTARTTEARRLGTYQGV